MFGTNTVKAVGQSWDEIPITWIGPGGSFKLDKIERDENNPEVVNVHFIYTYPVDYIKVNFVIKPEEESCSKACECGAESCGFTTHSSWCNKYEK
jgi:hypothetical protein